MKKLLLLLPLCFLLAGCPDRGYSENTQSRVKYEITEYSGGALVAVYETYDFETRSNSERINFIDNATGERHWINNGYDIREIK